MLVTQACPTFGDPMDCSPLAPLPLEFSRQEYCSGLPFPSPGIFPTQGSYPRFSHLLHGQAGSLPLVPVQNDVFRSFVFKGVIPQGPTHQAAEGNGL